MTLRRRRGRIADFAGRLNLDRRLAAYLTASVSVGAVLSPEAKAVVVSSSKVQPFGINGDVNIDFSCDGQIDYQIDHDRVNLNGTNLDYLQIDKNDASSAENPYPIDNFHVFPLNGTVSNADHGFMTGAGAGKAVTILPHFCRCTDRAAFRWLGSLSRGHKFCRFTQDDSPEPTDRRRCNANRCSES